MAGISGLRARMLKNEMQRELQNKIGTGRGGLGLLSSVLNCSLGRYVTNNTGVICGL